MNQREKALAELEAEFGSRDPVAAKLDAEFDIANRTTLPTSLNVKGLGATRRALKRIKVVENLRNQSIRRL